jgi:hypothetical protein
MSKQWLRCLLAGAMLALSVGSAQAATVFDNLGDLIESYSNTTLDTWSGQSFITSASPQGSWQVNSITLRMLQWSGTGAPVVSIYTDDPFASPPRLQVGPLASVGGAYTPGTGVTNVLQNIVFTPATPVVLPSNTPYWVVLSATGTANYGWQNTLTFTNGSAWYSPIYGDGPPLPLGEGASWSNLSDQPYQMAMDATGVPEPSTYALLMISLGVVGYARKRMNNKA